MGTVTLPPSQREMLQARARQLGLDGVQHDIRDQATWLTSCWPHVEDDPDPQRWSGEFRRQLQSSHFNLGNLRDFWQADLRENGELVVGHAAIDRGEEGCHLVTHVLGGVGRRDSGVEIAPRHLIGT